MKHDFCYNLALLIYSISGSSYERTGEGNAVDYMGLANDYA